MLCCAVLYCAILHCTVLYCTVLYYAILYCAILYCTVLCYTVLYCVVLYCTMLYCTVLCYTVLYWTVLYCAILHCAILNCAILYYTELCSTVLHWAILYHTIHASPPLTIRIFTLALSRRPRRNLPRCLLFFSRHLSREHWKEDTDSLFTVRHRWAVMKGVHFSSVSLCHQACCVSTREEVAARPPSPRLTLTVYLGEMKALKPLNHNSSPQETTKNLFWLLWFFLSVRPKPERMSS